MGQGFEVTNDMGFAQVIDENPLITLKYADTVIVGNPDYGYFNYDSLFALAPANNSQLGINSFRYIYDNFTLRNKYRLEGAGRLITFNENTAASPPSSNSGFGLEVYNWMGNVAFSSAVKPLKILDVVQMNDIRPNETIVGGRRTYWSKNYGSKEIAVMWVSTPIWGEDPHFMTVNGAKRGNVFALEASIEHTDGNVFDNLGNPFPLWGLNALILDVTGY